MIDAQATRMWQPWPGRKPQPVEPTATVATTVEPKSPLEQAVQQYAELARN